MVRLAARSNATPEVPRSSSCSPPLPSPLPSRLMAGGVAVKYGCCPINDTCVPSPHGVYANAQCDGACNPQDWRWRCEASAGHRRCGLHFLPLSASPVLSPSLLRSTVGAHRCVRSDVYGNWSDSSCGHRCGALPPPPPPPRYKCHNATCRPDESREMPYYFSADCDGDCGAPRPRPPPSTPRPPSAATAR